MAATTTQLLSLDQFRRQYAGVKPRYEYWFGEAIQKSVPTFLHALIASILMEFLKAEGYLALSEVELRIDPEWQPIPDVIGISRWSDQAYPTEPVDVVIEVLSPEDRMSQVWKNAGNMPVSAIVRSFGSIP